MDHTLRTGARRATDDDPSARAAHLAARLRAGELGRDQLQLAARLGDQAAELVVGPGPASTWTAAVMRWGPEPMARAAVAAARSCLPTLERPQRQGRLLREAERLLGAPVERRQAARTLRDDRYAPAASDSDEVVSRRWTAQEAVQGARVLSLWAESAAPLRLAVVSGQAAHARARAGLDPDGVLEQVRRALLPWLLGQRREPPPRPVGPPRPIFGWTDDEDALLPMLLVGWDDAAAEPPPAPLLHVWQQAGGYCFSRHPSYVGCALPLAANLERLGPAGGHLLCALDALGEDPRWVVLRDRFPALEPLTWTDGAPYDRDRLATLEAFLARHVALPALEPGGVEAALRLVPCDPLAWFAGWTTVEAGPDGLHEGPPFDAATYEAVVAWGREHCPGRPPRVHLAWRNCD